MALSVSKRNTGAGSSSAISKTAGSSPQTFKPSAARDVLLRVVPTRTHSPEEGP